MPIPVWFAPWKPGPDDTPAGTAVISVTGFTPHRPWTAVGAATAGTALRRGWDDVEGAIGLWLWAAPGLLHPRSGSVSVWRDARSLRDFVARHDHVRIMDAYRDRGDVRTTTWRTDRFDRDAARETARSVIGTWSGRP